MTGYVDPLASDEDEDPVYAALMADHDGGALDLLQQFLLRPAWHQDAACRGSGPDTFHPGKVVDPYEVARTYCERCSVTAECLEAANATEAGGRRFGMWGGTTPNERKQLAKPIRSSGTLPAPGSEVA